MRLRARRRHIVVWSSSRDPVGGYGVTTFSRPARSRPLHRFFRISWLLAVTGLIRLARGLRSRWAPVVAGGTLILVGVILHGGPGILAILPGILFLYAALLMEGSPDAESQRRSALERELAGYSTPAQRRDLEATLDRYPDGATAELRSILARQGQAARSDDGRIPGGGRH
jgi:hypothetical protein